MSENTNHRSAYVYPVKSLLAGRVRPASADYTPGSPQQLSVSKSSDDIRSPSDRPPVQREPWINTEAMTPRAPQSMESVPSPEPCDDPQTPSTIAPPIRVEEEDKVNSEDLHCPRSSTLTATASGRVVDVSGEEASTRGGLGPPRRFQKVGGGHSRPVQSFGSADNSYFPPLATSGTSSGSGSPSNSNVTPPSGSPSPALGGYSRHGGPVPTGQFGYPIEENPPLSQLPLDTSGISYGSSALPVVASGALLIQSPSLLPSPPLSGLPPRFKARGGVGSGPEGSLACASGQGRSVAPNTAPNFHTTRRSSPSKPNVARTLPPVDVPLLSGYLDDGSEALTADMPAVGTFDAEVEAYAAEAVPLPFNPSQYGLVHLPPLPVLDPARTPSSSSTGSSLRGGMGSVEPSFDTASAAEGPGGGKGVERGEAGPGTSSYGGNQSSSGMGGPGVPETYTTNRLKYAMDADGNHVVVGHDGDFQRCEDEPIRTPGAVQGFGVLIAVDEMEDTLVVRQVSENSTELLGLPPKYLFGLECFTDTLPETQASALWNNIQFLKEPDLPQEEEEDHSPHIFLLTGWGAPGVDFSNDGSEVEGRKAWTCWCAVHRAMGFSVVDSVSPGVIILEFELERDTKNPLYPPLPNQATVHQPRQSAPRQGPSGTVSPAVSVSTASSATDGSEKTLIDPLEAPPSGTAPTRTPSRGQPPASGSLSTYGVSHDFGPDPTTAKEASEPLGGLEGDDEWMPSLEDIIESTTSRAKPLPALERLRRTTRGSMSHGGPYGAGGGGDSDSLGDSGAPSPSSSSSASATMNRRRAARKNGRAGASVGMMDVFGVMAQINEQLGAAQDLDIFLKIVVGVLQDLTQFHRVMIYQFDELWNGQVVAELVDWSKSHDLYMGLHFPAGDIPAQARALYAINKVRLLYDREQPTARIVVRNKHDLEKPLDMTHCYLRAMSPIHIKYLENMGVRASMSVSILAFGNLWGLVTCHSYGQHGMRVSFPVRQMLRLISQSISRNIERLSYAQRLHTRKLINTLSSEHHPTGYIVSNADDLLGLFDADFGILVVGEGAKILGQNQNGQELLIMAEYLRLKQFNTIQASQAVTADFPDLQLTTGLEVIAGLLYVPLSSRGKDFIAFLRRGQPKQVRWAGKPHKQESQPSLEPRASFKIWSETVAGRCRAWTDEQLETAGVLALVYGKFIEVWREKENALQNSKLTNLLLSNASHEVRTPLNHIINYLEMALNGPLDHETRDNLKRSHTASKSLLFTINDLLDLTRLESGNETSFNEPFNLHQAIQEATYLYRKEAERRNLKFNVDLQNSPTTVVGDVKKIQTVVQNLTANSLKYTTNGEITVRCATYHEPEGLRAASQTAVEIIVGDTGAGMSSDQLDSIFREFEQVDVLDPKSKMDSSVGLGLAVVARIVEQLGGQLRVESKVNEGSQFSFLIPLELAPPNAIVRSPASNTRSLMSSSSLRSVGEGPSGNTAVDSFVHAISSSPMSSSASSYKSLPSDDGPAHTSPVSFSPVKLGEFPVADSPIPVRPIKIDEFEKASEVFRVSPTGSPSQPAPTRPTLPVPLIAPPTLAHPDHDGKLRVLIVEDNHINRTILAKRLTTNGHTVVNTTNGQEGFNKVEADQAFDVVLMDIQMPILNGFEATQKIRQLEKRLAKSPTSSTASEHSQPRLSHVLNGRIPVFAVSASLMEQQREALWDYGLDGWILKPIDFQRLSTILRGVVDPVQRRQDVYRVGCSWEAGGWLKEKPV